MKLTGKAKEAFEDYFIGLDICQIEQFNTWYESMQYGVLVDFFDSVGIYCDIGMHYCIVNHNELNRKFHYHIALKPIADDIFSFSIYDARTEARTAAIKKANEIFNNR